MNEVLIEREIKKATELRQLEPALAEAVRNAYGLAVEGDIRGAIGKMELLLEQNPSCLVIRGWLNELYNDNEQLKESVENAWLGTKDDPESFFFSFILFNNLFDGGFYEPACDELLRYAELCGFDKYREYVMDVWEEVKDRDDLGDFPRLLEETLREISNNSDDFVFP